jgi:hypothetical protein
MALVFNRSTFKFKDSQDKQASHKLLIPALTAGNFAATLADVGAYALALESVTQGNFFGYDISYPVGHTETTPPAGTKRGDKIQIVGQETVDNKRTLVSTIPTALLDRSIWDTDDHYLPTAAAWISYISAYSALAISPAGNALTFRDAVLVTRTK